MAMYSAKSFPLRKAEFDYLLPAMRDRLHQSGESYAFIARDFEDVGDMLDRLKGCYGNFDELPSMMAYKCSVLGSLTPFREHLGVQ